MRNYGRNLTIETLLVDQEEATALGKQVLGRHSRPLERITALELGARETDWTRVLRHAFGDQVIVRARPPGVGLIEQVSEIRGRRVETTSKNDWGVRFALSSLADLAPNLLSEQQAGLEAGTSEGWTVGANATIGVVTPGAVGSFAVAFSPVLAGLAAFIETTPTMQSPVVADRTYATAALVRLGYQIPPDPNDGLRAVRMDLVWRDAAGAVLGIDQGTSVALEGRRKPDQAWPPRSGMAGFQFVYCQGIAPASASFATIRIVAPTPYLGEWIADQAVLIADL
jgi:hypothetical protein